MERAVTLFPLSNEDAVVVAVGIPKPDWLIAKHPVFEMRDDELCAVWQGGRAVWTGEEWQRPRPTNG